MVSQIFALVFLIGAGLWWTDHRFADLERAERDKLCATIAVQIAGPSPVPGPVGDRARDRVAALEAHRESLGCRP